jgi:predicted ATPase
MAEAISLAKAAHDPHVLALALWGAAVLGVCERNPAEVDRVAVELMELSTRQHFADFLWREAVLSGWVRSVTGATAEGLVRIEDGIEDWRATDNTIDMPFLLAQKAEVLHLADRTPKALEVIAEAQTLVRAL